MDEKHTRVEIEVIMAGLAAGDLAWLTTLRRDHGMRIAAAVRRILRELGQQHVLDDPIEVGDIVDEVCFDVIADKAGSWRPDGGALPWTWAEKAIRQLIVARIGHRNDHDVDEEALAEIEAPPSQPAGTGDTWQSTCRLDPRMELLDTAVRMVTSERDYVVVTEYIAQKMLGDRSPGETVAAMTGLTAANARQVFRRARLRLRTLAATDPTFQPLAVLGILTE